MRLVNRITIYYNVYALLSFLHYFIRYTFFCFALKRILLFSLLLICIFVKNFWNWYGLLLYCFTSLTNWNCKFDFILFFIIRSECCTTSPTLLINQWFQVNMLSCSCSCYHELFYETELCSFLIVFWF